MNGFRHLTIWTTSTRVFRSLILYPVVLAILVASSSGAFAQEPPLSIPNTAGLGKPGSAVVFDRWLLYPSISVYTTYSDNVFQSSINPISAAAVGAAPSLVAEWSNGIHRTTLYGNADRKVYPGKTELDTFDWQAGFVQNYEMRRESR